MKASHLSGGTGAAVFASWANVLKQHAADAMIANINFFMIFSLVECCWLITIDIKHYTGKNVFQTEKYNFRVQGIYKKREKTV